MVGGPEIRRFVQVCLARGLENRRRNYTNGGWGGGFICSPHAGNEWRCLNASIRAVLVMSVSRNGRQLECAIFWRTTAVGSCSYVYSCDVNNSSFHLLSYHNDLTNQRRFTAKIHSAEGHASLIVYVDQRSRIYPP